MSLKTSLLKPMVHAPISRVFFGETFPVRRLSAARLNKHDKDIRKYRVEQNSEKLNEAAAQILLESILDEKGKPMSESVTAKQLMAVHSPVDINAAGSELIQLNFLGDEAETEAKKD